MWWAALALPIVLAGGCVLAFALQAPTWRVARSRTIHASPERVRDVLSDVRAFAACCGPAEARAPAGAVTFSETSRGVGAWLEWGAPGARERGTIETVGPTRMTMRYDVAGRVSHQIVDWRPVGAGGTEVTWAHEGDKSGIVQRLVWPVAGLERRVGGSIETALASLARVAAATPAPSLPAQ